MRDGTLGGALLYGQMCTVRALLLARANCRRLVRPERHGIRCKSSSLSEPEWRDLYYSTYVPFLKPLGDSYGA